MTANKEFENLKTQSNLACRKKQIDFLGPRSGLLLSKETPTPLADSKLKQIQYDSGKKKKNWPNAIKRIYMIWPLAECNIKFCMIRPAFFIRPADIFRPKYLSFSICQIVEFGYWPNRIRNLYDSAKSNSS